MVERLPRAAVHCMVPVEVLDWHFLGPCHSFKQDVPARATSIYYLCFAKIEFQAEIVRHIVHARTRQTALAQCQHSGFSCPETSLCLYRRSQYRDIKSRIVKLETQSVYRSIPSWQWALGRTVPGSSLPYRGRNLFFHHYTARGNSPLKLGYRVYWSCQWLHSARDPGVIRK